MGLFGKSTSKQTAKLKSLVKLAAARLAVVRRPRLGRRSIARSDVGQLLSIGHLDRALVRVSTRVSVDLLVSRVPVSFFRQFAVVIYGVVCVVVEQAEQVIEEDNMLEALDVIELYCKILIEQTAQLEKPKYVQTPCL